MKHKVKLLLVLSAALALALSGCKISIGKTATLTEVSLPGIRSMAVYEGGVLYMLTDSELKRYDLDGDKKLEQVYDAQELSEAELNLTIDDEKLVYGGFIPELIFTDDVLGVSFAGRYTVNDGGRDGDIFVLQGTEVLGKYASYYNEISRDYGADSPIVNGLAVNGAGTYLKLNRSYLQHKSFDEGLSIASYGLVSPRAMPDNVIGALEPEEEGGDVTYLVRDGESFRLEQGGQDVYSFDGAAAAFVQDAKVYAVYPDGVVKEYSDGGEKELMDLSVTLKPGSVGDPFLWDGQLYWFDEEGVKTAKN